MDTQAQKKARMDVEGHCSKDFNSEETPTPIFNFGTDFSEIINTSVFVDKSLLIKELLNDMNTILISAPRKFGKSTNMDMVKRFLEIQVDERGSPKKIEETSNYKLFKDNEDKLEICRDTAFFNQHFGKYPVVYIDFKPLIMIVSYNSMLDKFREILLNTYRQHEYLLKVNDLWIDELERAYFRDFVIVNTNKYLDEADITGGFDFLAEILHKHFEKQVFVMIDTCDSPITALIMNPQIDSDTFKKILGFVNRIMMYMSTDNKHMCGVFSTCSSQIAGAAISQNKTKYHSFLQNHNYIPYYGFTDREVRTLLATFNMSNRFQDVESWYNGYKPLHRSDITIYNTWSVVNYLKYKTLKNYWAEDRFIIKNLKKLITLDQFQSVFRRLLDGKRLVISSVKGMEIEEILCLKNLINTFPPRSANEIDVDLLLEYLCDGGGYFTKVHQGYAYFNPTIDIPNGEIRTELIHTLFTAAFYIQKYNFDLTHVTAFSEALQSLDGKDEQTFASLRKSIEDLYSNVSVKSESEFHGSLYALARNIPNYYVYSDVFIKRVCLYQLDILIIRPDGTGIILELNFNNDSAENSLKRIFIRRYHRVLDNDENKERIKKDKIYMGVHINQEKKISLCYLVNSYDFKNIKSVPCS